MSEKLLNRSEVDVELTWDISHIFKNEDEYQRALNEVVEMANELLNYKGELNNSDIILKCVEEYEKLYIKAYQVGTYASLAVSVDETNQENQTRMMKYEMTASEVLSSVSFVESELKEVEYEVLNKAIEKSEKYRIFLEEIKRSKPHALHPEVEKTLAALSPVLGAPSRIYNQAKLVDMDFAPFKVGEKEYPLSFVLFENQWEMEPNTDIRRTAFEAFSQKLDQYKHTIGSAYQTQLQKEKTLASLRGHKSIFDFLLFDQNVDKELYDRQIDVIMEKLAPHMRRYAQLIKKLYNLDKVTFADLKVPIDPEYNPKVTVEEAKQYSIDGLKVMGEDYLNIVKKALNERWVDFAQNKGKSTGGFCASPYGVHSYILLSWTGQMGDLFTLVHELGHAGHFYIGQKHNNMFSEEPSLYFIEAPSTINEMLLSNHLIEQEDDPRFKRWVLSSMVANTYYHNFVTHLLEAAYQREVYKIIDAGGSVHADKLSEIKREVLEEFWGDAVEINKGAELTWMRQPHYYMGLYPYTYSAGLTVATDVSQRILKEGKTAVEDWIEVLKAGGTKSPVELAKMAKVDITTEEPLNRTIEFIGGLIDEIEKLTNEIK
ncbi:oligoendopeptidase F [Proteinivorax tanatarense]|uniref:Oligopeptidase F n=1 Tax=Proteinivorax tanatarense TaxID=1260629 RepID=A0AAU7VPF6_9FIRM